MIIPIRFKIIFKCHIAEELSVQTSHCNFMFVCIKCGGAQGLTHDWLYELGRHNINDFPSVSLDENTNKKLRDLQDAQLQKQFDHEQDVAILFGKQQAANQWGGGGSSVAVPRGGGWKIV